MTAFVSARRYEVSTKQSLLIVILGSRLPINWDRDDRVYVIACLHLVFRRRQAKRNAEKTKDDGFFGDRIIENLGLVLLANHEGDLTFKFS